jgi:phosphatidylserine decarboxylase
MKNVDTPVAVEGFPFIGAGAVITILFAVFGWNVAALLFLLVTLFITFFFRNPERRGPDEERAVLAPADGVVIYLGNAFEEHLGEEMLKISIFMSVFNVHVNRVPATGKVLDTFYVRGKFLDVRHERATFENEQCGMIVETAQGWKMVVVQVAGLIARRIVTYVRPGDAVHRGDRYGLIRFGSRLDVYLPASVDVAVKLGDRTTAGETVLGYFP